MYLHMYIYIYICVFTHICLYINLPGGAQPLLGLSEIGIYINDTISSAGMITVFVSFT
jgi:hypothetical protein